ncbi:F-box only protein 33 [Bagarius yarrelli]|uniref:F-box only protein 33 n=1 Tax=Bagarius yarrelli TaxID=175774 RepID=A0A556VVS4_BAGYA|nr:F-box only protein 33 [Bagarius yarrelli]
MALRGSVGASALPSELIVHIFSFLSERDKLRASAVCTRWRECLFYPALWSELKVRFGTGIGTASGTRQGSGPEEDTARLEFLMRRFGSFVRDLRLEFGPLDACGGEPQSHERWRTATLTYLQHALCVFSNLRNNRIQQLFEDLLSNSRQLKWLSCSFMSGVLTPRSLSSLSNSSAETLQHLSLLHHQTSSLFSCPELQRLSNLRSLSIDYCHFSSSMCQVLADANREPLSRLSLLLNGAALEARSLDCAASDSDVAALTRRNADLRVFLMVLDVSDEMLESVLKPNLPLQRIHMDSYVAPLSDAVIERVSLQYHKTLTHFVLTRDDGQFPDLSGNRNEDPLVLLAWRCVHLSVLVIHGYTVWSHNLVAISRLRGSSLRVLDVSEESIDFDPDQALFSKGDPVQTLVKEVSQGLGRAWHPSISTESSAIVNDPTLHFHSEMQSFSESA